MKLVKTAKPRSQETDGMQYSTPVEVEQSLKRFAERDWRYHQSPFRVGVVARYGGKPQLYTVVIRCAEKEPVGYATTA